MMVLLIKTVKVKGKVRFFSWKHVYLDMGDFRENKQKKNKNFSSEMC